MVACAPEIIPVVPVSSEIVPLAEFPLIAMLPDIPAVSTPVGDAPLAERFPDPSIVQVVAPGLEKRNVNPVFSRCSPTRKSLWYTALSPRPREGKNWGFVVVETDPPGKL